MVMEVRQCRAIVIDDSEVRLFFSYQASGFKTIGFDDVELDLGVLLLEDAEQARNQQGGLMLRHAQAHRPMAAAQHCENQSVLPMILSDIAIFQIAGIMR